MKLVKSGQSKRNEYGRQARYLAVALSIFAVTGCGGGAGTGEVTASGLNKAPVVVTMGKATTDTDAAITLSFSAEINEGTLNGSTFKVAGPDGSVSGSVGYDRSSRTATFTPHAPLMPQATFTVSLGGGLADRDGNPVPEQSLRVQTGKDLLARGTETSVPTTLFGQHMHRALAGTAWPAVNFGSWRLWDAFVTWPDLEPVKGQWNFTKLDAYVAMAEQHGVEVLLPLSQTPRWASARPDEPSAYGYGKAAEPADIENWRNYVATVASRYKGRIRYYELWNEINAKNFYTGNTDQMLLLAKTAYQTIKAIDPAATVISPSFCPPEHHTEMFDEYLAKGGADYSDAITYHFYVKPGTPEKMISFVNAVKSVMARHGVTKPLWNTETGWYIESNEKAAGFVGQEKYLTYHEGAAYIARAYLVQWAMGVDRFYLYAWDNFNSGLVQSDGATLKPSHSGYNQIVSWLKGARVLSCGKNRSGIWVAKIAPAAGGSAWIVWTEEGESTFTVPREWGVTKKSDLYGATSDLSGGTITAGIAPVLLTRN